MNSPDKLEVPAATAWPIVLAFGLTLVFAGFVTAASVSILGAILAVRGAVGWFRQVLPVESLEWAPMVKEEIAIETSRESVERVAGISAIPRAWLPIEIYPISAGIKGGLAGSAAMALMAGLYGIVSGNGTWYAMDLLVAGLFPAMASETATQIGTFNLHQFLVAVPIHLFMSLLVGLLFWSDVADAPAAPNRARRGRGSANVVRPDLRNPRLCQPGHESTHRLVVVCRVSNRIRDCSRARGCGTGTNSHPPASTVEGSYGY